MKTILSIMLLSIIIVSSVTSCKKKKETVPTTKELLVGTWKYSDVSSTSSSVEVNYIIATMKVAVSYGVASITLNADNTYTLKFVQQFDGEYELLDDDKTLIIDKGKVTENIFTIIEISENKLVLEQEDETDSGENYKLTFVLVK